MFASLFSVISRGGTILQMFRFRPWMFVSRFRSQFQDCYSTGNQRIFLSYFVCKHLFSLSSLPSTWWFLLVSWGVGESCPFVRYDLMHFSMHSVCISLPVNGDKTKQWTCRCKFKCTIKVGGMTTPNKKRQKIVELHLCGLGIVTDNDGKIVSFKWS